MLIISDRLCLSVSTFCTVSVIGMSVKSHIGASLNGVKGLNEPLIQHCLNLFRRTIIILCLLALLLLGGVQRNQEAV